MAFVAHAANYTALFTNQGVVLNLPAPLPRTHTLVDPAVAPPNLTQTTATSGTIVRLDLAGAGATPRIDGADPLPGTANYLVGSAPQAWHTNIPTYGGLVYHDIAPGVDLAFHGTPGSLEYDYTVTPGADPSGITLAITGTSNLNLNGLGALLLHTVGGDLTQALPHAYQEVNGQQHTVSVHYVVRGLSGAGLMVGLAVGAYDHSQPLVIDPVLSYSTYLGGSGQDQANAVAVDGTGNVYLTGNTFSTNFPTTTGAYSSTFAGPDTDAFVSKLSPDGKTLLYSTYLGGSSAHPGESGTDYGRAIAVNGKGNAYVAGVAWSGNFPTTAGAYQTSNGGNGISDAFVTELSADGRSLVYSTYLGGSAYEGAAALALDGSGDAYVAGMTVWDNRYGAYPTTANAYQTTFRSTASTDPRNATLSELSPDGSQLLYSTLLGGSGHDEAHGLAVDAHHNVYVVGMTDSPDFPTKTSLQSAYGGGAFDAFVTKINTNATALAYSSYLGGSGDDRAFGIAAGGLGSAAVVGQTGSTTFPTTSDALQGAGTGATSAFVTGLASNATGPGLLGYSSYLQGASGGGTTSAAAVAKDGQSNIVVVGQTNVTDLPGTAGTPQASNAGGVDAFLSTFITTPTCPSGEDCVDIGDPALSGDQLQSGSRANGTWAVTGSGSDIWNTSDQFHFVAQDAAGDGSISAHILGQTNTGPFAKAGVMYRASEDPTDAYYFAALTPANGGTLQVQYRSAPGAVAQDLANFTATAPLYVRVRRSGNQFVTIASLSGDEWRPSVWPRR